MRLKLQRSRVRRERRVSAVILSHTHTQSYQPVWSFEVRQDDITDCEAVGHMITTVTCLKALSEHCLVWLSSRGGSWCPPNRKEPLPLKTSPWIHSPHTPCYHVQHVQINMFTAPLQPASSIMFHLVCGDEEKTHRSCFSLTLHIQISDHHRFVCDLEVMHGVRLICAWN